MKTQQRTTLATWIGIIILIAFLAVAIQLTNGLILIISIMSFSFLLGALIARSHYLHIDETLTTQFPTSTTDTRAEAENKPKEIEQTKVGGKKSIHSVTPTLSMQASTEETIPQEDDEPSTILVDEKILQQIIKDTDVEVMPELIKFYIIESKDRVETITNAAHTEDLYVLEFEAHTLGSSSLTLGNVALSTLARQIELHCIQHEFSDALAKARLLPKIAKESFLALEQRNALGFTN
ncbi:Hpt domain-containing protein [Aliivibrio logei]|uniref:Hpt domain-containing protein n=1 Tax=Aliivibrio logei TaxID=688 RepID=UPI0035C915E2